jgi:uncharacterized protein (TIGR02145 family)
MKFVISVLFFLLLVFGYKAQVPSYVPSNGLVGWWPFNGNANDASSNGNNGTVNGAVLTTDRFGNVSSAYDFHQTGHITLPSLNVTSITINAWVKRLPGPVGAPAIVSKHYTSSTTNSSYLLYHQEAEACVPKIYYTNTVGSPFAEAATGKNDCDDAWHMITGVVSAAQIKIYYDGILVSTNSNGGSIKSSTFNTLIGRSYANNGALSATTFGGKIDDVGIWNRALSDCEVAGLYFAGNPLSISVSNKIICSGQTATLSANPSIVGGGYLWSTNATTSSISISPTTTTNYSVTYNYGSCHQATTSASIFVGNSSSWTGSSDSDWHKPCNWNPQAVPTCCQSVYIPLTVNQPVVSGTASCKDISIESSSGALLTVNSNANLQIETCPNISTQNNCIGSITSLNCASALTTGTFISGQSITNGSAVIPYSGGDGGNFNGQVFTSTGVNGLTAVLSPGNFANGSGNITLAISGTPITSGTASFTVTLGGQSCTLNVSISTLTAMYPAGSVFCASGPTVINDVTNPTTGKTWMDRNLGASQVATSSTDAAAYGDLYQWGRRSDGHQCRNSATTTTLSSTDQPAHGNFIISPNAPKDWRNPQNTNLWQGVNGVNNPCPSGYVVPSEANLEEERNSWIINNSNGAFASSLKIPLAGYRDGTNGTLMNVGGEGKYWSRNVSGTDSRHLDIDGISSGMQSLNRSRGRTIRCIKETVGSIGALNCGSTTIIGNLISGAAASGVSSTVPYTGGNGGFYAAQSVTSTGVTGLTAAISQGLFASGTGNLVYTISGTPSASGTASFVLNIGGQTCNLNITVYGVQPAYPTGSVFCASGPTIVNDVTNPTTGKTWMDRNLGASQVASSSTDAAAYGDLYQWGRRSDGHQCRNSATTTTLSSTDQPAHGNFILVSGSIPGDWRNPQNNNLWQGISGVNNPCPSGYRIPTEIEMNNERLSWVSNNGPGAFSSPLKWNLAGYRMKNNGTLSSTAVMGSYWTSTSTGTNSYGISFLNNDGYLNGAERSYGLSIRCIKDTIGSVGTLNCGSATVNGNLISGASANGVSASVPYTVGNGGFYAAQSVTSTGVTGLTISISQGLFASGSGNLVYTISGTPSASGTASFVLNIGGQTCNLNITVNSVQPAYPTGSVFCASGPTLVNDVTNPTTGKTWMDRNLGASQIATSLTDQNAYGDLYQWGRRSDGHQCRNSGTTNTLSSTNTPIHGNFIISPNSPIDWRNPQNTNLWQGVNGVNNPCPSGYRVPSQMEMYNEQISWPSNDGTGAFSSVLMWTLAGSRIGPSAVFIEVNTDGYYWNSNTLGLQSSVLRIQNNSEIYFDNRADALSIRCIKETVGSIGALNCGSSTITGNLISGSAASGVSASIPYTGGNGGFYAAQSVASTGVTGLTASISQGLFASSAGSLVYTISGTPSSDGPASFALNIGGQMCTMNLSVALDPTNQYPTGSVFCNGPTLIVDVTNPTTGRTWMDRNLGASQVATSSTDAASYGDLYQWGRRSDGHQCRNSATTTTLSSTDQPAHGNFILKSATPGDWRNPSNSNLWQSIIGINNPCPLGYRIPTQAEWNSDQSSWSINSNAGAFSSVLKYTAAGGRLSGQTSGGSIVSSGIGGIYWSSTVLSSTTSFSIYFGTMDPGLVGVESDRSDGSSVRCIKETVGSIGALNCGSATITGNLISGSAASGVSASIPYTGGNGGFYAAQSVSSTGVTGLTASISQGLFASSAGSLVYTISGTPSSDGPASFALNIGGQTCNLNITVYGVQPAYPTGSLFCASGPTIVNDVTNPTTGKTWMDRNLGASQVATSSTDAASYGDLYQWGRRSDGHQCRTSPTTATLSSVDQPTHGNFILAPNAPYDWRSPQNTNLWQGVNGINNPCPTGYRLPTETEWNAEDASFSSQNAAGAFASPLKLPMAGSRDPGNNGILSNVGTGGGYWSSSINSTDSRNLNFSNNEAIIFTNIRGVGSSIRCIKD